MTTPRSPDAASRTWLVGSSPSRTLVARSVHGGQPLLVKIYESGSPAEAARELELGRRLAGPGVAVHVDVGTDPDSGRPCLIQQLVPGQDLQRRLDQLGPRSARAAATVARAVAAVLARFHGYSDGDAPAGFAHADVKPSNVMVDGDPERPEVVLLDLESAIPVDRSRAIDASGFTGGTHGFAPPEAYRGAAPTSAFDVFGLGATLHALLGGVPPFGLPGASIDAIQTAVIEGRRRRWLLAGCPEPLISIVDACLAPEPDTRPTARDIERRLAAWLADSGEDDAGLDQSRLLALRGMPEAARDALPAGGRHDPLRARLVHLERLLQRIQVPTAPAADEPILALAGELDGRLAGMDAFLLRFPLHERARAAREQAARAAARLPLELPEAIASLKRRARLTDALRLSDQALAALRRIGRLPLSSSTPTLRPSAMERDPTRVLTLMRRDAANAADAHARVESAIREAEAAADPPAVEAAIGELAMLYGGASPVVAAAKDRLHRLEFYLARIGQQAVVLDDLSRLLGELGLDVDLSAAKAFHRSDGTRAPSQPRGLLRALHDLVDAFPALGPRAAPACDVLNAAMHAIAEKTGELIREADRLLATPPIPIRPLTSLMARLDRVLQLDALVDLEGRSRLEIRDQVESLRTRIEQARAERDRMTRGAQEAMDRGHLTTAIYDMARAVDRFGTESGSGAGLAEQFEEAKRRKREIEEALERNHELAARYGDMLTDPTTSASSRIATLQEREHVLSYLCAHLGAERAGAYVDDLRGVQIDLLREHAADGERRLLAARDPAQRLSVARRTFDALQHESPDVGWSPSEVREARALSHRWMEILEDAVQETQDSTSGRLRRGPRRRGWLALGATLGAMLAALVVWIFGPGRWNSGDDTAAALRRILGEPVSIVAEADRTIRFDGGLAIGRLREFVDELRAGSLVDTAAAASNAVELIVEIDRGVAGFQELIDAVDDFRQAAAATSDAQSLAVFDAFERRVLRTGLALAARKGPDAELARLLTDDARLRRVVSLEDADTLRRTLTGG